MKYVHPDIVIGEAIPEIEPRIDRDRLVIVRRLNTWWRWCLVIAVALVVVSFVLHTGIAVGIGMVVFVLVLWISPILRPAMRAEMGRMREASRLQKSTSGNIWNIPFRDLAETQIMMLGLMVIFLFLNNVSGGLGSILSIFGIYAFMGGFGVIVYGYHARQPGQISCVKCSYPLVGLTIDCRCPECGIFILSPFDTSDCPRIRSPWFWRIGLTMTILGGAITFIDYANPAAFYAPVPRSVLFNLAPTDQEAFERLINNPMTQEEIGQLIERFITRDVFDEGAWVSYRQRQWLGEQFALGLLSDEQVDRILEPYLDLSISAPDSAQVGERITLWINNANQIGFSSGFDPNRYFGGFIIGDDPTPRGRSAKPKRLADLQNIRHDVPSTRRPFLASPKPVWIPEEPGIVEISATIVIAIFQRNMGVEITWGDDGHAFDVQPDWIRTIELRHTIAIEPASESDNGG